LTIFISEKFLKITKEDLIGKKNLGKALYYKALCDYKIASGSINNVIGKMNKNNKST
jgi:hypothetical protein